jgi:hypothetical protein
MRYLKIRYLSREKKKSIEKYSIAGLAIFLGLFFIASLIIGYTDRMPEEPPSSEEIISYAKTFMPGYVNEDYGTRLDCSGFTRTVYKNFSVQLPPSSAGQYEITTPVDIENINPGNLLFFTITGSGISHVAICLDSKNFIHSPGKGRKICVNSLEQPYWKSRFISAGRVNFKEKN